MDNNNMCVWISKVVVYVNNKQIIEDVCDKNKCIATNNKFYNDKGHNNLPDNKDSDSNKYIQEKIVRL